MDGSNAVLHMPDAELFGRDVAHVSGVRLGRINVIVHHDSGDRLAFVRAGALRRRWAWVSLRDAQLVGGRVVVTTNYGRTMPPPGWDRAHNDGSSHAS